MKRSRFTEEQIIAVCVSGVGRDDREVRGKHGLSSTTFKAKFGGMEASQAKLP